jgi:AraC-like DNA-binding protein
MGSMFTVVSLDQLPSEKRAAAWRDAVCNAFVKLECEPDRHIPMRGRLESGSLGDLHVARVACTPQQVARTAAVAQELMALALDSLDQKPSADFNKYSVYEDQSLYPSAGDSLVWRAQEYIRHHLSDADLTPANVAARLHVSLRRLQEVFQSQGTTVSDCIWAIRLDWARQAMLGRAYAPQSIGTIAGAAGFHDLAHFSRRFKSRFGMSPSEFRLKN